MSDGFAQAPALAMGAQDSTRRESESSGSILAATVLLRVAFDVRIGVEGDLAPSLIRSPPWDGCTEFRHDDDKVFLHHLQARAKMDPWKECVGTTSFESRTLHAAALRRR